MPFIESSDSVPLPSSLDSSVLPVLCCQPRPSNSIPLPSSAPSMDQVVSRVISWSATGWFQFVIERSLEQDASAVTTEIDTESPNIGSVESTMSTSPPALSTEVLVASAICSPSL